MYKIRILIRDFYNDNAYTYTETEYADTLKMLYVKTWQLESNLFCIQYEVFQKHSIEGWIKVSPPLLPVRNRWQCIEEDDVKEKYK